MNFEIWTLKNVLQNNISFKDFLSVPESQKINKFNFFSPEYPLYLMLDHTLQ